MAANTTTPHNKSPELCVVMPFYNEQECLEKVVNQWTQVLEENCPNYRLLLLADCPKDQSTNIAHKLVKKNAKIAVLENPQNLGHGQTCLKGYRQSIELKSPWILQIDSDGQCDPQYFPKLWKNREKAPIHQALRVKRLDGIHRFIASRILELAILARTGIWVKDPNCPYRLMKTDYIEGLLELVPQSFDLANIGLGYLLCKHGAEHNYFAITFLDRAGGKPSAPLQVMLKKFWQLWLQLPEIEA